MTDLEQFDLSCPHAGANLKRGLPLEKLILYGRAISKQKKESGISIVLS